jgi:hypothetical protein
MGMVMPDIHDVQTKDKSGSESEEARDELIFHQDLNEVYLLMDFVSGRSDRSLSTLKITDPGTDKELSASETVEAISQMRYPPDSSKRTATSRNSTILHWQKIS